MLLVGFVTVTAQEAAFVSHPSVGYFELVQESHTIKPVVEPDENGVHKEKGVSFVMWWLQQMSALKNHIYSLLVSDLELPGPVSQEASADPFWDFASDVGADGLGGLLH